LSPKRCVRGTSSCWYRPRLLWLCSISALPPVSPRRVPSPSLSGLQQRLPRESMHARYGSVVFVGVHCASCCCRPLIMLTLFVVAIVRHTACTMWQCLLRNGSNGAIGRPIPASTATDTTKASGGFRVPPLEVGSNHA